MSPVPLYLKRAKHSALYLYCPVVVTAENKDSGQQRLQQKCTLEKLFSFLHPFYHCIHGAWAFSEAAVVKKKGLRSSSYAKFLSMLAFQSANIQNAV